MFAKTIFGKEPYIVLTFRLFHQYHERGDENAERYAYDLKKMYTKSEKILIPNTVDEFCDMLKNALLDTFKY